MFCMLTNSSLCCACAANSPRGGAGAGGAGLAPRAGLPWKLWQVLLPSSLTARITHSCGKQGGKLRRRKKSLLMWSYSLVLFGVGEIVGDSFSLDLSCFCLFVCLVWIFHRWFFCLVWLFHGFVFCLVWMFHRFVFGEHLLTAVIVEIF